MSSPVDAIVRPQTVTLDAAAAKAQDRLTPDSPVAPSERRRGSCRRLSRPRLLDGSDLHGNTPLRQRNGAVYHVRTKMYEGRVHRKHAGGKDRHSVPTVCSQTPTRKEKDKASLEFKTTKVTSCPWSTHRSTASHLWSHGPQTRRTHSRDSSEPDQTPRPPANQPTRHRA